jgi:hypothetical protein
MAKNILFCFKFYMRISFQPYQSTQVLPLNTSKNSFERYSKATFDVVSFGNNKDFVHLPVNEIIERVDKSINPTNLLGRGGEASVYSINDTDYCVRIPLEETQDYKKGFVSELTPLERVNHGVVKLGEKAIIMKKLDGFSMFPRKETGVTRAMVHSMIDEMPVSAYRQVIEQIAKAREQGAYFDSSGANVLVDPVKKTMTIIDFTACEDCAYSRVLKSLFITLGMNDGILTNAQQKDRANKILSAVVEDFLPGKKPIMRISEYAFSDLIYAIRNQGLISKPYANVFINTLNELKELKYMSSRGVRDCENQMIFLVKKVKSLTRQLLT